MMFVIYEIYVNSFVLLKGQNVPLVLRLSGWCKYLIDSCLVQGQTHNTKKGVAVHIGLEQYDHTFCR